MFSLSRCLGLQSQMCNTFNWKDIMFHATEFDQNGKQTQNCTSTQGCAHNNSEGIPRHHTELGSISLFTCLGLLAYCLALEASLNSNAAPPSESTKKSLISVPAGSTSPFTSWRRYLPSTNLSLTC